MDDTFLVCSFKGLSNLLRNVQRLFKRNRTFLDSFRQRRPFDQLQHQTVDAVSLFQALEGGDVGMVERSQDLCFPLESGHALCVVGEDRRQDLESNFTTEFRVSGAIDLSHPALAELGSNPVMRNVLAYRKEDLELMGLS